MKRRKTIRVLAIAAAVVCLSALPARAETFTKTTDHYEVVTDISEEFTTLVAQHMEAIYREYAERLKGFGEMKGRFEVAVYKERKSYLERMPPGAEGSGGAFVANLHLLTTFVEGRTNEDVFRTLYHEGLHQFVFNVVSPNCPIWLNEGLAEYFSYASWNGRRFRVGGVPTENLRVLQAAIRDNREVPFGRILAMTPQEWLQNVNRGPAVSLVQYSQAWGMVHFLVNARGGRYSRLLQRYIRAVADGEDAAEAFEDIFGNDLDSFHRAWREYILALEPDPMFVCRDNMAAVMWLALSMYQRQGPGAFRELDAFQEDVLGGRYSWSIQLPAVGRISSREPEKARSLFCCPAHRNCDETSYVLARPAGSETPVLVCLHHPGVMLKAYYVRGDAGRWLVRVEEVVRGTVPREMQEAVKRAMDDD